MSPTVPRGEHPRPDRRRERWASLNGWWDCALGALASADLEPDEVVFDRRIVVPFAFQSEASGIGTTEPFEVVWYRRRFEPPPHDDGERVLVHLGAVDFAATVWVDGTEVGDHRGGHTSFTVDVTDALDAGRGEATDHELVVRAVDELRSDQLRGKQTATFPYLVHYTPTSGIWQPVWTEVTGPAWVHELHVVAGADGAVTATADVRGDAARVGGVRVTLDVDGRAEVLWAVGTTVTGTIAGVRPWSPADPVLCDLRAELVDADGDVLDTVHGHVGFRTVAVEGDRWLLNGAPLRQRLLLDQGYWPDSLLTPPTEEAILTDLRFVKDAGFDGVRKHQKIEDPRVLWHADRLGVLVWEELPSPFGLARIEGALADDALAEWTEAIGRDGSHPAVIAWVPFNESWGIQGVGRRPEHQATVRRFVAATRALDPTRPVIDNSGWGHVDTDVVDVHDYEQDPAALAARWTGIEARGWDRGALALDAEVPDFDLGRWLRFAGVDDLSAVDPERLREMLPDPTVWAEGCVPEPGAAGPLVLSELGGIGLATGGPVADRFDYVGADDAEDLLARFAALVAAAESVPELRGWCWTQLADTEQEVNGLLTAARRPKVDPARLRAVLEALPWSGPRPR
ncbi:MAG: glycoside hydrolase family 2 TIM barrel-domain containing protein [Acidimicrobiales bacterium]